MNYFAATPQSVQTRCLAAEDLIQSVEEKQIRIPSLVKKGKTLDQVKQVFNIEDRPGEPGGIR